MPDPEQPIIDILIEAAKAGGKVVLSYYKTRLTVTEKSSKGDLLTQADIKSQEAIISTLIKLMLKNGFSENDLGFIAEENFIKQGKYTFIIDPLDGTSSFVAELHSFAVSIGYAVENKILAGVIYQPTEDTVYFAEEGKGAFTVKNDQKIKLKIKEKMLKDSLVYYNSSSNPEVTEGLLRRLSNLAPHVLNAKQNPCISLNLMELAKDNVQIVINGRAKLWDIAAAKLIVEEAGGNVRDWNGNDFDYDYDNPSSFYPLIASHPTLIDEVVKNFFEKPQIVIVGSMTHSFATYDDRVEERFGGGVSYGGQAAATLGLSTTVITIGAKDLEPGLKTLREKGITTIRVNRNTSNNNSNDYRNGQRKIQARSIIDTPFLRSDFGQQIHCSGVLFFPGLHEIIPHTLSAFDAEIIFLDVGGLSRTVGKRNEEGLYPLNQGNWDTIDGFRNKVDILKVSHEDLENIDFPKKIQSEEEKVQNLAENGFPIVLFTKGEKATILARKSLPLLEIPTYKLEGGDPAGAGEVFSIGFIYEYLETDDPVKAVAFGNACSSFKIAGENYDYRRTKERAKEILARIISS
jgi:myo-inositol-1(or 4)-monophosphatase